MQAEEFLKSAKREAEALRDSAAAAKAEAERGLDGLNAQQAETAQLHISLSAQSAAQMQREVNKACLHESIKVNCLSEAKVPVRDSRRGL